MRRRNTLWPSIMKMVMEKYNNLWNRSMPYIMLMHQRPSDGDSAQYDYYRFHIEFYPPYRTPDKLKYLAGSEAGARRVHQRHAARSHRANPARAWSRIFRAVTDIPPSSK